MRVRSQLAREGTKTIRRADVVSKRMLGLRMLGKESTSTPTIRKSRPARRREKKVMRTTLEMNPFSFLLKESITVWKLRIIAKPRKGQEGLLMSVELVIRPRPDEVP